MDPDVGNNGEHELSRIPLHRFVCCAVRALGFVCRFGARTDDSQSVIVDIIVLRPDSFRLGERLTVASDVCGLRPNKAYQVVDYSRFVVRDLEEERRNGLSKSCDHPVWVGLNT